jgi:hypothetical protein
MVTNRTTNVLQRSFVTIFFSKCYHFKQAVLPSLLLTRKGSNFIHVKGQISSERITYQQECIEPEQIHYPVTI